MPLTKPLDRIVRTLRTGPRKSIVLLGLIASGGLLWSCGDPADVSSEPQEPVRAVLLDSLGGDTVYAVIPVVARVEDAAGSAVSGELVYWGVEAGEGSVNPEASTSDRSGRVATSWRIGSSVGTQRLYAWWENPETGDSVALGTFSVEVGPGQPVALAPGYDTTLVVGEAGSLQVAARDRYGNGLEGGAVGATWTSSDPAVASVDPEGVVTAHEPGRAEITATITAGGDPAVYSVVVVRPGMDSWVLDGYPDVFTVAGGSLFLAEHGGPLVRIDEAGPDTVASLGVRVDAVVDGGDGAVWVAVIGADPEVYGSFGTFRSADSGSTWVEVPSPDLYNYEPLNAPYLGGAVSGGPLMKTRGDPHTAVDIHRWNGGVWTDLSFPPPVNDSAYQIMPLVGLQGDSTLVGGLVQRSYGDGGGRPYAALHVESGWQEVDLTPWAATGMSIYRFARRGVETLMLLSPRSHGNPTTLLSHSAEGVAEVDLPYSTVGLKGLSGAGGAVCVWSSLFAACAVDDSEWHRFDAPAGSSLVGVVPDGAGNVWLAVHESGGTARLLRWPFE